MAIHFAGGCGMAAAPVIGTASARGAFRLDHATVAGNATLFEGSLLETAAAASSVSLSGGTRLSLERGSRARLFGDRLILEQGETHLRHAQGFRLEALGLRVEPGPSASTGRISLEGARRLRVAALAGSLRVRNARGQLVANLPAGVTLAFEPQQDGNPQAVRLTGVLEDRGGHYLLTDEVTSVRVELVGAALSGEAGRRLEITGTLDPSVAPAPGASEVVRVTATRRLAGSPAAAAGQGGRAAAGGATMKTVTILGGVAAAAAVGGLAAAEALPGQGESGGVSR
jgi:hypothetical protein